MKKDSNIEDTSNLWVIGLTHFHSFGWGLIAFLCIFIWPNFTLGILGVACIGFSIWSFVGYKRKWKHIFYSYSKAFQRKKKPQPISWDKISKMAAYEAPICFLILGLVCLGMEIYLLAAAR